MCQAAILLFPVLNTQPCPHRLSVSFKTTFTSLKATENEQHAIREKLRRMKRRGAQILAETYWPEPTIDSNGDILDFQSQSRRDKRLPGVSEQKQVARFSRSTQAAREFEQSHLSIALANEGIACLVAAPDQLPSAFPVQSTAPAVCPLRHGLARQQDPQP